MCSHTTIELVLFYTYRLIKQILSEKVEIEKRAELKFSQFYYIIFVSKLTSIAEKIKIKEKIKRPKFFEQLYNCGKKIFLKLINADKWFPTIKKRFHTNQKLFNKIRNFFYYKFLYLWKTLSLTLRNLLYIPNFHLPIKKNV
ncbi:hypothetical protein BpHYR1_021282 [Brachionus plicatilis]|uniref:Uncharacterized protein n=1 Tax=Brachionus plicatilis TaxID=10195 RepID=A0A3M7Q6E5_BRAPC|nr:hypothetical protein BpHYR1_021282 [Brachionus plicatilis]